MTCYVILEDYYLGPCGFSEDEADVTGVFVDVVSTAEEALGRLEDIRDDYLQNDFENCKTELNLYEQTLHVTIINDMEAMEAMYYIKEVTH